MSKSLNHIFFDTDCPTDDVLLHYVQGKLSSEEKRAVELHIADCEMCSDAVEGLMLMQNPEEIIIIENELNTKIDTLTSSGSGRNYGFFFKIAASILLLAGLGTIIFFQVNSEKDNIQLAEITDTLTKNSTSKLFESPTEEYLSKEKGTTEDQSYGNKNEDQTFDNAPPPPTSTQMIDRDKNLKGGTSQSSGKFYVVDDASIMEDAEMISESEIMNDELDLIAEVKVKEVADERNREEVVSIPKTPENSVKVNSDLTSPAVVDSKSINDITATGSVVSLETASITSHRSLKKDSKKVQKAAETRKNEEVYAYEPASAKDVAFSEQTAGYIIQFDVVKEKVNDGEYKEALGLIDEVEKSYSKDEALLYYKALCYYKLNKAEDAEKILKKLGKEKTSKLYHDIRWYYALTLISLNKTDDAIAILRQISESDSSYKVEAQRKLNELNKEKE